MSGAKRGCLQAQLTTDAAWEISASTFEDGADTFAVVTSGGTYYITELLTALETALNAAFTTTWTVTGSFGENGTYLVTIDTDGTDWTLTWDYVNLRNALGFAANITTTNAAQTGTLPAKGVFLPDCPKHTVHGDGDEGDEVTDLLYTMAPDGTTHTVGSTSMTTNHVKWSHLSRKRARISGEVLAGESWQQFWRDCHRGDLAYCEPGAPVRLIWDADVPGTYKTYKIVDKARAGEITTVQNWNGLYTLELDLVLVP